MILKNARILGDDFRFFTGDLRIENGVIAALGALSPAAGEPVTDLEGAYLLPGLVETHFHGAMGLDSSLGEVRAFETFSAFMATRGITTFVPALISSPDDVTERYIAAGREFLRQAPKGAKMGGFYLEGPFISTQYRGAHDPAVLQLPDLGKLQHWQELAGGLIRKTVIAPELPGAEAVIRWASTHGITVEIGHSAATYAQAKAGIDWGARLVTHVCNAMSPLHHREPGMVGAALTDDRVTCELIADFGHVAPPVVQLVCRAKGDDRVNIISDSVSSAGLPDGDYTNPDGRVIRVVDGLARLENGTIMGSASTVLDGMRHLLTLGIPLESAVKMASRNPARTIGLDDRIGSIAVGKCADLAVLDRDLEVIATYVDGNCVYSV